MENPINFNPQTMTVSQVMDCAEALKTIFDIVDASADNYLSHHIKLVRKQMADEWK